MPGTCGHGALKVPSNRQLLRGSASFQACTNPFRVFVGGLRFGLPKPLDLLAQAVDLLLFRPAPGTIRTPRLACRILPQRFAHHGSRSCLIQLHLSSSNAVQHKN